MFEVYTLIGSDAAVVQ